MGELDQALSQRRSEEHHIHVPGTFQAIIGFVEANMREGPGRVSSALEGMTPQGRLTIVSRFLMTFALALTASWIPTAAAAAMPGTITLASGQKVHFSDCRGLRVVRLGRALREPLTSVMVFFKDTSRLVPLDKIVKIETLPEASRIQGEAVVRITTRTGVQETLGNDRDRLREDRITGIEVIHFDELTGDEAASVFPFITYDAQAGKVRPVIKAVEFE